ncbi:hypothetical protein [Pelovirga terrestris]|uniref:Uncharacterized protein n=1 Tax=Pelovirga terrestris TaxID=2771352 RepID=A0A8J6UKQ7_9BACT|nr:hypothetical protein [Pelovirga terrestris]MBD1399797.1 hypothetical protein [Pelovirga terrestris]
MKVWVFTTHGQNKSRPATFCCGLNPARKTDTFKSTTQGCSGQNAIYLATGPLYEKKYHFIFIGFSSHKSETGLYYSVKNHQSEQKKKANSKHCYQKNTYRIKNDFLLLFRTLNAENWARSGKKKRGVLKK